MKRLTLPHPAAGLWAAARDIIHEIPTPEEADRPIEPHIAGGSALAARWRHRDSTGIDIIFPGRVSLTDLLENDPRNILDRLGGTLDVVDHRHVAIDFPDGSIDLAAIDPQPGLGQARTVVDGRLEMVLSSAQILRDKLGRAHDLDARDVFDVATAAREDPSALATALNMLPEYRTTAIAWAWSQSGSEIRERYLAEELLWTSPNHRLEPHELAARAADAIRNHRYQRLQVDVEGPDITITKTVRTATLPVETYNRSDPADAIIESGLAAHLAVAGPVRPARLASAIEMSSTRWGVHEHPGHRRQRLHTARGTARPDGHTPCTKPRMDPRPRAIGARGRNCLRRARGRDPLTGAGNPRSHCSALCTGAGLFSASAISSSNSASRSGANRDTSDRQRRTCSTAMISAFRFAGAFPVATAYAWPAMKVYQPCRAASRSSFLPTSRARFSSEGSSRASSSVPARTWRSTRSASGSSETLSSVVVITRLEGVVSPETSGPLRSIGPTNSRIPIAAASD